MRPQSLTTKIRSFASLASAAGPQPAPSGFFAQRSSSNAVASARQASRPADVTRFSERSSVSRWIDNILSREPKYLAAPFSILLPRSERILMFLLS